MGVFFAMALLYLPLWRTFLNTAMSSASAHSNLRSRFLLGIYDLYVLFVSESVAP
jgi:hypothetical protein